MPPRISIAYSPKDDVIDVDATGTIPSPAVIDEIFDRVIAAARARPRKVYVLTCWAGVELDVASAKQYGKRMEELTPVVLGVVRYSTSELTRIQIRSEVIKHRLTTGKTRFYETRADALAAIRRGEV